MSFTVPFSEEMTTFYACYVAILGARNILGDIGASILWRLENFSNLQSMEAPLLIRTFFAWSQPFWVPCIHVPGHHVCAPGPWARKVKVVRLLISSANLCNGPHHPVGLQYRQQSLLDVADSIRWALALHSSKAGEEIRGEILG